MLVGLALTLRHSSPATRPVCKGFQSRRGRLRLVAVILQIELRAVCQQQLSFLFYNNYLMSGIPVNIKLVK